MARSPTKEKREKSPKSGEERKEQPAHNCCVDSFTAPANAGPRTVTRPTAGSRKAGQYFQMLASFKNETLPSPKPQPCQCTCCEYRQEVKGFFKLNGRKLRHMLTGGQSLSETVWREDGFRIPINGVMTDLHFGHRDEHELPDDRYLPRRADGCTYSGNEYPGLTGAPGAQFEIDLQFRGSIIDTCSGKTVQTKTWSLKMKGRLSRRPRYWS